MARITPNTECKMIFRLFTICLLLCLITLPRLSEALPASARLFQKAYGYKVSCLLCHSNGGGSTPNAYGKTYLRAGANASAFKRIEGSDSDEDGIPNIKEILAKSNPGNKKSVPGNIGDWLDNVAAVPIPKEQLEKIFPGYTKFSAVEGSLNAKQVEFLKAKIGSEPTDDDKVPSFYFAEKGGKREAVGQLISVLGGEGKGLTTGVAVSTNGKVLKVEVLGGASAKSPELKEAILKSFEGKTLNDLGPKPEKDGPLKLLHESVVRSLALIQTVFGGAK